MSEEIMNVFEKVKPIISKTMRTIRVKSWNIDDYYQEGLIVLNDILNSKCKEEQLYVHFKVKYRQKLIDIVRKTQAQKRYWETAASLDVYESESFISSNKNTPEELAIYNSLKNELFEKLSPSYQVLLKRQLSGETLTRMEKHRLKEKIKRILFDDEQ
ncbi:sigma-70 family RNA polymerase sigma factor [Lactococcus hircilactis]|uniref:sigma-70 family RNA polymerase sigma factor n=1 Tax=Lactococcus hircilactis TaxID=1494462 RepID=UPI003FA26D8E